MEWLAHQFAALRGDDFPAAVVALISLVLVTVSAWALLVGVLATMPALRGAAIALTPRVLRGLLVAGVAGALAVPSAHADERSVDGLRLPDRPLVVGASSTTATTGEARPVVVRPGDTLWAIARTGAGAHADSATIARDCRRWHATNRGVIGDDPDLIQPGQRLTPPSEDHS